MLNPPNVPCWRNFPLASEISAKYKVPVKIDNDANAAALAETRWGAARGFRYVFYATIGTGIGTGIVFDGAIYHGNTGSAGEGGHVSIDYRGPVCNCGKRGCIEVLASGPAIGSARPGEARSGAFARIRASRSGARKHWIYHQRNCRTRLRRRRSDGTRDSAETAELLTYWLGNIVDLLDPDVIVMGGGVAAMLKPFFAEISKTLPELVRESARGQKFLCDGPLWSRCRNRGRGRALRLIETL